MYLNHFGLNKLPFGMTPDPSFFFAGNKRGEILEALIYAVLQGDGIIKVTGEVGCGKTMLCRMLESRLPDNIEIIYLVNPTLTSDQVIFAIAGELELPITGKRVDEVIRMLHTELVNKHIAGKQVVLLVEEAQAMSLQTLEEIRLFTNLETAHHKLLQIVLFGQPELDDHLNTPGMRQLRERITNSFSVPPLKPANLPEYLMFRLRSAGYQGPDLFDRAALRLISRVSEGIIRRVSILADKSMLAAYADNAYIIKSRHVKAAIRDSEFPRKALYGLELGIGARLTALAVVVCLSLVSVIAWQYAKIHRFTAATMPTPVKAAPDNAAPDKAVPDVAVQAAAAQPLTVASTAPGRATPSAAAVANPPVRQVSQPTDHGVTQAVAARPISPSQADGSPVSIDERIALTARWLNSQPADKFSIQLAMITSGNKGDVARYLNKMETEMGLRDVYLYAPAQANPSRIGIVFGSYASREDALNTLNQIAAKWGYRPQLRTIGGIKKEIGKA